jgi:hypothetical protein
MLEALNSVRAEGADFARWTEHPSIKRERSMLRSRPWEDGRLGRGLRELSDCYLKIDSYSLFSMATAASVVIDGSPWKANIVFQTELIQSESLM